MLFVLKNFICFYFNTGYSSGAQPFSPSGKNFGQKVMAG
jgi:hypothetical protein